MIVFLYRIMNACGIVWFTRDPMFAQQASEHGCIVTCRTFNDGNKIFKGSKHNFRTTTKPE